MILNYTKGFVEAFTFMIILSTLATVIAYGSCALAELYFSLKDQTLTRARLFRNGVIAILAFGFSLFLMYGSGGEAVFYGVLLLALGIPVYFYVTGGKK